jgi:hypothetical protein
MEGQVDHSNAQPFERLFRQHPWMHQPDTIGPRYFYRWLCRWLR